MSSVSTTTREKPHTIIVHPLVLLSATDHFYRVARDTQNRRVVGLLLGESFKGRIDITNSFAIVSFFNNIHTSFCVPLLTYYYHLIIFSLFNTAI